MWRRSQSRDVTVSFFLSPQLWDALHASAIHPVHPVPRYLYLSQVLHTCTEASFPLLVHSLPYSASFWSEPKANAGPDQAGWTWACFMVGSIPKLAWWLVPPRVIFVTICACAIPRPWLWQHHPKRSSVLHFSCSCVRLTADHSRTLMWCRLFCSVGGNTEAYGMSIPVIKGATGILKYDSMILSA